MKKFFAIILTFFISYLVFLPSEVSAKILNKELVNKVTLVTGYKVSICEVKISSAEVVSYSTTASEISYFNNPTAVACLAGDEETLVYGDVVLYLKDNAKVFDHIILYNDLILREDSLNFSYYDDGSQGGTFMVGDGTNAFTKVKFAQANTLHNTDPKLPGGQETLSDSGAIMHYNPTNGQVDSMLFAFKGKVYKLKKVTSQTSEVVLVDYTEESLNSSQKPPPSSQTDETATWKTYTNMKYGYTIKYPQAWQIQEDVSSPSDSDKPGYIFFFTEKQEFLPGLRMYVTATTTPEQWIGENIQFGRSEKIIVAGSQAVKLKGIPEGLENEYVFLDKGGQTIVFFASGDETLKHFNQILSTLKFTSQ